MGVIVVGVGTNLGAREAAIRAAPALLESRPAIEVSRVSPIYETEPLGPPQAKYLNAAIRLETSLSPPEVLDVLLRTERRLGRLRNRDERWGPRSIDLDLLWDSRGAFDSQSLHVPHRELPHRSFALGPALDVAPELEDDFASTLQSLGGRPALFDRGAIVDVKITSRSLESEVEADSLPDACALCMKAVPGGTRPWSTRHAIVAPSAEGFVEGVREVFRTGFSVHRATVSHCSKAQWTVEFHGVNTGFLSPPHVRLETTSGTRREVRARLTLETSHT